MDNVEQSPVGGAEKAIRLQDKGSGVRGKDMIVDNEMELTDNFSSESHDFTMSYVDGETSQHNEEGMQNVSPVGTVDSVEAVASNQGLDSYVEEPKVGMIFRTWQEVEEYYKDYAEQKGFGVSRVQGVYSKGEVRDRITTTWRCECYGRPDMRAQREAKKRAKAMNLCGSGGVVGGLVGEDELSRSKRRSKKCECKAMIYARLNREGQWVIKKAELEHSNHTPNPADAKLVKEYRMKHLTRKVRRKLFHFFDEGVPVSQIYGCLRSELGGSEALAYTVKDLQHEIYKCRRLKMEGGDSNAMMKYFQKMQAGSQNFYHSQRVDDQGRLKDVLWVDARSWAAYEEFGDVVCFDATYLTNEYDLPFINFVGVNHHGQSILFGCALVSHEDCDTYEWVFKQWLECMNNKAPMSILTDQAAAMRRPIEEVMPNTRHRWCIWHIMRKIPERLGKCERYRQLKVELKATVYDSITVMEFETRWNEFIAKYKLESNAWLHSLYVERHMWVPAFMREYFWAGMKTTQRVESINSFFDGFVNRRTKLHEFPQKYAKAMDKRVRDENDADARCAKYIRRLVSGFTVEKLFQKLYTDTKFQEVQKECSRLMYCFPREQRPITDNLIQYVIEDRVWVFPEGRSEEVVTDRRRYVYATYDKETKVVCCDCRKFETNGIMCKHIIRILDLNQVVDIPQRYIVSRWRKDILRKHTRVKVSYHDPNKTAEVRRYNSLMNAFESICEEAAMVNDETVSMVVQSLESLKSEFSQCRKRKFEQTVPIYCSEDGADTVQNISENNGTSRFAQTSTDPTTESPHSPRVGGLEDVVFKDPVTKKRGRGRPKGSRNKGLAEIGYKKPRGKHQNSENSGQHPCSPLIEPPKMPRKRGRPKGSRNKVNTTNTPTSNASSRPLRPRIITVRRRNLCDIYSGVGASQTEIMEDDDILVMDTSNGVSDSF